MWFHMRSPYGYTKTHEVGEIQTFIISLEAGDTQTTVMLDCEGLVYR